MSRFRFDLAAPDADADLRRVLAETPMGGHVAVTFRREPSWFAAASIDGRLVQVVACRDGDTGRVVGFGCRCVRELYVNGRPEAVGYLSSLRLLRQYRNRGLVARGYAFLRQLHTDGRVRLYLTTIAAGNAAALAVLTSGRAGLPGYHPAGNYHTLVVPLARPRRHGAAPGLEVRPAAAENPRTLLAFLKEVGPRRQFFPVYREEDFFTAAGALRDLEAEDVLLAFRGGRLVGTLAGWDLHGVKQTVVEGYGVAARWLRPLVNVWARLRGLPGLPAPGAPFRYLTAALPVVADDCPEVFAALLEALRERVAGGPCSYLLLGLHEADPLLPAAARFAVARYTTHLFLVCWQDGEDLRGRLDGRVPYLELGSL